MSVVRNAHRLELYNCKGEGGAEGEPEREERGRVGGREIFFHCMPAAALISWSILVECFADSRLCR